MGVTMDCFDFFSERNEKVQEYFLCQGFVQENRFTYAENDSLGYVSCICARSRDVGAAIDQL